MRRIVMVVAGLATLAGLGVAAAPANAVPGTQAGVYYEVYVGGERVAEQPGSVRVFTTCNSAVSAQVCAAFLGLPPQSVGVFAGDTRADVWVQGEEADY